MHYNFHALNIQIKVRITIEIKKNLRYIILLYSFYLFFYTIHVTLPIILTFQYARFHNRSYRVFSLSGNRELTRTTTKPASVVTRQESSISVEFRLSHEASVSEFTKRIFKHSSNVVQTTTKIKICVQHRVTVTCSSKKIVRTISIILFLPHRE